MWNNAISIIFVYLYYELRVVIYWKDFTTTSLFQEPRKLIDGRFLSLKFDGLRLKNNDSARKKICWKRLFPVTSTGLFLKMRIVKSRYPRERRSLVEKGLKTSNFRRRFLWVKEKSWLLIFPFFEMFARVVYNMRGFQRNGWSEKNNYSTVY